MQLAYNFTVYKRYTGRIFVSSSFSYIASNLLNKLFVLAKNLTRNWTLIDDYRTFDNDISIDKYNAMNLENITLSNKGFRYFL